MKLVLVLISLIFSSSALADSFVPKVFSQEEVVQAQKSSTLVLSDENTITIRGEITGETASKAILAIQKIKGKEATIVINSPGGSVIAGNQIVDAIRSSRAKITCIPLIAASMAFVITQACDVRVALPSTVMMQHQISGGAQGPYEQMKSSFAFMTSLRDEGDEMQASRMKISVEDFRKMVLSDVFFTGKTALAANAVDSIGSARCSESSVDQTYTEEMMIFIFKVQLVWSKCPLAVAPLSLQLMTGNHDTSLEQQKQILRRAFPSINDIAMIKEINR
jgi:ATP-dependent protease ClpP protease subunit